MSEDPELPPAGVTNEEALRHLEQRLNRASELAEQLIVEAAGRVAGEGGPGSNPKPPPAGWQQTCPRRSDGSDDGEAGASAAPGRSELDLLLALLNAVRDRIPPELQHRLAEALREVLLAVRALIDWYLERADRRRAQPDEVQDIPIL